ncbi:MAG: sulfatase-like hydrolase/transferase [Solirubrobacterales bacterium]
MAALTFLLAAPGARAAGPERPPSFLHILTDDQTLDSLPYMPQTMRLLGKRGTRFDNHHAVQPLCCPARASFLSGQYPHNHHVLNNLGPDGYAAFDFSRTLYTALDAAGYRTGWVGKVMNVNPDQGIEPEPGFDDWFMPLAGSQIEMFDFAVSDNGWRREFSGRHQNLVYTERAKEFIEEAGREPFMLTLALTSPHWSPCSGTAKDRCPPAPAPRDLDSLPEAEFPLADAHSFDPAERVEADRWWQGEVESLQSVDRTVSSLIAQLRRAGRLDDTYVVFQSDNGLLHGEHGFFDKNLPWDRSVRVPMLIRGPGFERGAVRTDLTANVDVPATILARAGVTPPLPLDGHSLLGERDRRFLLLEKPVEGTALGFAAWQQIKTRRGWTYWRRRDGSGKRHLYHLPTDPNQLRNRYRREPKLARRLERKLRGARDCAAPCP